jgi:hypothetical protein
MESPGQLASLHLCCVCHSLVPFERALAFDPEACGANSPLHAACAESERRWSRRAREHWSTVKLEPSAAAR